MKRLIITIATAALALTVAAACGSDPDNVGACEAWIDATSCGDTDLSSYIACSSFENYECDVSDYFDCLTAQTTCDNGVLDNSGWASCASKSQCD